MRIKLQGIDPRAIIPLHFISYDKGNLVTPKILRLRKYSKTTIKLLPELFSDSCDWHSIC